MDAGSTSLQCGQAFCSFLETILIQATAAEIVNSWLLSIILIRQVSF